ELSKRSENTMYVSLSYADWLNITLVVQSQDIQDMHHDWAHSASVNGTRLTS
ncbi:27676_t:CDS:1, partial [Dentiscutata erythropus]